MSRAQQLSVGVESERKRPAPQIRATILGSVIGLRARLRCKAADAIAPLPSALSKHDESPRKQYNLFFLQFFFLAICVLYKIT